MDNRPAPWGAFCAHGPSAQCNCALSSSGTEQSLDELEFFRSACAAAQDGDVVRLQRILARNPAAIKGDGASYTPLHYAARAGQLEVVELLLKAGADPNAATRGMAATPLHRAALQGHSKVVERLLNAGADPAAADCDQETPLHKAAAQGHVEVCRLLLAHCPAAATTPDKRGRTPAQRATGAAAGIFASLATGL